MKSMKPIVLQDQQGVLTFGLEWEDLCAECGEPARGHHHLSAEVEMIVRELKRVQQPMPDDVMVLTPARLAERWAMPVAKVRELCRAGLIPARKLGPKEWVVPVAALREWAASGLYNACTATLQSPPETTPGQAAPAPARPYRVEVRRPLGRAPGHRPKVGSGSTARQPDGRAPDAAAGAAD